MPPKKKSTTVKRRKPQAGRGLVSDALKFAKDRKLVSTGLALIPHPAAQLASKVAGLVGLGGKKRVVKASTRKAPTVATSQKPRKKRTVKMPAALQRGSGIFSDLGSGIGSVFGGLGHGIGSAAHGFFGAGRKGAPRKSARSAIAI